MAKTGKLPTPKFGGKGGDSPYCFKIPEPRGLDAGVYTGKIKERNLISEKPTDANQLAPTPENPVPAHFRMAGGR